MKSVVLLASARSIGRKKKHMLNHYRFQLLFAHLCYIVLRPRNFDKVGVNPSTFAILLFHRNEKQ